MKRKIAVIGAGSTGHAMSAILASKGHTVILADSEAYKTVLDETREKEKIELCGTAKLCGSPACVTTEIKEAVREAELIVCCTVSTRDEEIARTIAPCLEMDKAVLVGAGNGASIVYHQIFKELGHGDTLVGEVAGNFFPCRLIAPAKVRVGLPLMPKMAAAFPVDRTQELVERFSDVWELHPCTSLFEALFNGPNLICHGAGVVSNLAAIDRNEGTFNMFKQGISPGVLNITDMLWKEKKMVYEAMGCKIPEPPRKMLEGVMDESNQAYSSFREMDGPDSLTHRYITEDVPYLICFFISIARAMEVEVPLFEAIVRMVSSAAGIDYYANGRTLENLGLSQLSKTELVEFFRVPFTEQESKGGCYGVPHQCR